MTPRRVLAVLVVHVALGWFIWSTYQRSVQEVKAKPPPLLRLTEIEEKEEASRPSLPVEEELNADAEILVIVEDAVELGEAGDWTGAIALLSEAKTRWEGSEAIVVNLSRALLHRAGIALETGHASEALLDAKQAKDLDSSLPSAHLLESRALIALGNRKKASSVLVSGLEEHPGSAGLLALAGDLAQAEGDNGRALRYYEKALLASPDSAAVEHRVTRTREEVRVLGALATHPATHFEISYNGADASLRLALPDLVRDLEDAWIAVDEAFGLRPSDLIQVLLLDRSRYAGGAPEWSSGLYDGRIRVAVSDYASERESLRASLRHEHAHAALHRVGARLPTWIQEGLAQIVEGRDIAAARLRLRESRPSLWLDPVALQADWTSWTEVSQVTMAYDTALSVCAWLAEDFGGNAHRRFVQALESRGFEGAFRSAFGISAAEALKRHQELISERR
ncbi:MAG TPA: hypothetical protein DDW23_01400 [Planctomycetes bacterium]|nr:hypothetical protein [Planctomycetota bacterium]